MIKILISNLEKILENNKFVKYIKDNYKSEKILFVPSSPNDKNITEKYAEESITLFKNKGIVFSDVDYIDYNSNTEDIKNTINEYSLIFLMGGITEVQNKFLKDISAIDIFKNFNGIIVGMSAGALNMCNNVIETEFDDEINVNYFTGLSLVDFVIDVHFDINNSKQVKAIDKSQFDVYCISDNGAIVIDNKGKFIYGDVYLYRNKQFNTLCNV